MIEGKVVVQNITVTFYPEGAPGDSEKKFVYSGDASSDGSIYLPTGISLINFTLETETSLDSTAEAEFHFYPIELRDLSEEMQLGSDRQWFTKRRCGMMATNANVSHRRTKDPFYFTVVYKGVPHVSSDPTLINDPPEPPTGGGN